MINTQNVQYEPNLKEVCTRHGFAVCEFSNKHAAPVCNVPPQCFEVQSFSVDPRQKEFFINAMGIVRVYIANVSQCLLFQIPAKILNTLSEFLPIKDYITGRFDTDTICDNKKYHVIELVPPPGIKSDPKMHEIEDSSHFIYSVVNEEPLGISAVHENE